MRLAFCLFIIGFISYSIPVLAQDSPLQPFPHSTSYLSAVTSRICSVEARLNKKSKQVLNRMQRQEEKFYRKLAKKDSLKAAQLLADSRQHYEQFSQRLNNPLKNKKAPYIPYLDTLKTSLKFLNQSALLQAGHSTLASGAIDQLESRLVQTEHIKSFIAQRQLFLKDKLGAAGMLTNLKRVNKEVYYYAAQVQEYKTLLSDPKKLERKALQLLQKSDAFQAFMRDHSQLASLFRLPGTTGAMDPDNTAAVLQGLQTRTRIQQELQQRIAAGGPNAQTIVQQNIQQAQAQLSKLKNKFSRLGGGSSDLAMPDFKPNNQHTKRLQDRLEYTANIQSQGANRWQPSRSELGLMLGYKLNDKSTAGIGGSYGWGWGKPIKDIRITHESVGLRSFIDWQLKGSIYLSAGYEKVYNATFRRIEELRAAEAWQDRGLVGLSKKYKIGKKKACMQLLWDFLSYRQATGRQAIVFRVGYSL